MFELKFTRKGQNKLHQEIPGLICTDLSNAESGTNIQANKDIIVEVNIYFQNEYRCFMNNYRYITTYNNKLNNYIH